MSIITALVIALVVMTAIQILIVDRPFKHTNLTYIRERYNELKDKVTGDIERWRYERELKRTPVYAKLISLPETRATGYGKYKTIKRALIGDWVGGYAGSLIGAMTTPENDATTVTEATFLVRYKDNHAGEETVDIKGQRCRELLAVLDEEQAEALLTYNSLF